MQPVVRYSSCRVYFLLRFLCAACLKHTMSVKSDPGLDTVQVSLLTTAVLKANHGPIQRHYTTLAVVSLVHHTKGRSHALAGAVSRHIETSKNTKATFKCNDGIQNTDYCRRCIVMWQLSATTTDLRSCTHPPAMEVSPPKAMCGWPNHTHTHTHTHTRS